VISAISRIVAGSAGTETICPPTCTSPELVPKAIVLIGTLVFAASSAAACTGTPTVGTPSESSTIVAASWPPEAPSVALMVDSAASIPLPVAVPCPRVSCPIASMTSWWSVVGVASTRALSSKATRPTWKRAGTCFTNSFAVCTAASSRSGATSLAAIDADVSMASMTIACWRGIFTSWAGRASPTTSATSDTATAPAARCRPTREDRAGAIRANSSGSANAAASRRRRRVSAT